MNKKELDAETIGVLVDQKLRSSIDFYNSKISSEREKVIGYYSGDLPVRQKDGSSSYISNDVYDSVEGLKAQLLETFASGFEIVHFDPQNPQDVESSRIATAYTDYVVFRQNEGYKAFNDVMHDGLTARVGIAKVYWEKSHKLQEEKFEGMPKDQVEAMASLDSVHEIDADIDSATGCCKGKLVRKIDTSQVRIEVLNPEEFAIEHDAKCLSPDYFMVHRTIKTISELERIGYDISKLKDYNIADETAFDSMPEKLARFRDFQTGITLTPDDTQDEMRHVLVNECYMKIVTKGSDEAKLHRIVRVGNNMLEMEEVDRLPFIVFVPLPIPHSFYGNSYAKRVIPAQNVRTTLTRQIIDHANITNNPRYMVTRGGLTNPRELLDNRLGGIVNVTRPDAVNPLPQYGLNPFVFQALQMIDANNEKTTGVSSLSQGLNKDAISSQNSQGMIQDLVNLSQTRQKVIARNFANNFLIPLYLEVYQLVLENEDRKNVVQLAGNWVDIDPRQWAERKTATVSFHLGYGEQDREAMKRVELATIVAQDPSSAAFFQPPGRYKYLCDIFKLKGIPNVNDYLTPPEQLPKPQPDPIKMQEMQNETTKAQAAMLTAQAHQSKNETQAQLANVKLNLQQMQDKFDNYMATRDSARKDHAEANRIDISQREMHIAEIAPPDDQTIISPRG